MDTTIRILIVDDDPLVVETLNTVLECYGYKTSCTTDGYAALNAIQSEFHHIAIIDIVMPDMDGIELMTEIRRLSMHSRIIMMTAYKKDHPLVRQAISGKPDKLLYKPIDPIQLASMIDYYGNLFKGIEPPHIE